MSEKLYTEGDMLKAINETRESANMHNKPSQETLNLIDNMKEQIQEIRDTLEKMPTKTDLKLAMIEVVDKTLKEVKTTFVTKDSFRPVRIVAYGMVCLVAGGFFTLLFMVLDKK